MKKTQNLIRKIVLIFTLCSSAPVQALVVGSTLLVSLQPLINFPLLDIDNTLSGFAWFKSGFTLGGASATGLFDSVFPVSGTVSLNGGALTLNQDLYFSDVTTLSTAGKIIGNGHFVNYPTSITTFPAGNNTFQDCVVYINNDITLTSTLTFAGTCILNGNGHTINVNSGAIIVGNGGTLTITNAALKNVSGTNIQCLDNAGTYIFDNVTLVTGNNFTFNRGKFNINNEVVFKGNDIFAYQSTMTSTVLADATWTFDLNFTFSYDAPTPNLLQFTDDSSVLVLKSNAGIHATNAGLNLTKGTLFAVDSCFMGSEIWTDGITTTDNGITIGDCVNPDNDFVCNIDGGVMLTIASGSLNYKNVNFTSLLMGDNLTSMFIQTNASLNSYKPMNMGNTVTVFADNSTLGQAPSAPFTGNVATQGTFTQTTLADC